MCPNRKYVYLPLILALSVLASCAKPPAQKGNGFPAKALQKSSAVYEDFEKVLAAQRKDNEFAKFSADSSNYQVFISEDDGGFIYTFQLKPFHGNLILDGRVTYRVSEDGGVHRKGVL